MSTNSQSQHVGATARAPAARALSPRTVLLLAACIFFLSGLPALVYQLTWQRILALHSGVGIYSVAMIVAAFMAGLGIGSELGGRLSLRFGPRGALWGFAVVELSIAGFAALSPWLYYGLLYEQLGWLYTRPWLAGACHFLALLPPTCLMGMSLPLLVRAMVVDASHACRTIGRLYGVNGLGAAVGALLTPWLLIPTWGIAGAIYFGVALNLAAGAGALALVRWLAAHQELPWSETGDARTHESPERVVAPALPASETGRPSLPTWALLYATSGFCALGLEMVWFRLIDVGVKSTAFTFGTVLAIFLAGLSLGSLLGARLESRWREPLRTFLLLQCSIAVYAGVSVWLIVRLPIDTPVWQILFTYWRQYEPFVPDSVAGGADWTAMLALLYILFPTALLLAPTILMGLSFAVLQRAVHDEARTSGRKVGLLQAANIVGSAAGSLFGGLVALELWGTAGTLRLLVGLALLFAAVGAWRGARLRFAAAAAALVLLVILLPDQNQLWRRMHGLVHEPGIFAEDASGLAAVTPELGKEEKWRVSANGIGHSHLPYGDLHTLLGAVPAVVHPAPQDVAIIGLGSGDTAWAVACRPETERVDIFEICAPQQSLLQHLDRATDLPQLSRLLADDRIRVQFLDGRNALRDTDRRYDLIEADASRADSAYGGNLYSEEFFRECADRLKPGGVMCTWCPTSRVYTTFCQVFPYRLAIWQYLLVGSREPLAIDMPRWRATVEQQVVADYLGAKNASEALRVLEWIAPATPKALGIVEPNRDLFPRDEFHHRSGRDLALVYQYLGQGLSHTSDYASAQRYLSAAVEINPELAMAHGQLGTCWLQLGDRARAQVSLNEALRLAPEAVEPAYSLGQLLLLQGSPEAAVPFLEQAANAFAANSSMAVHLATALARSGRSTDAIEWLYRALERRPERWEAAQGLAWILATDPNAEVRDPDEAVRWARDAVLWSEGHEATPLDALAAAYAALGEFTSAVATAERAIRVAQETGQDRLAVQIAARLNLYRNGQQFVQPPLARPIAG